MWMVIGGRKKMSKYKILKDNIKNVVAQEFERTIPIITEEYEAKIRRQAAEITRLLAENERLKPNYENIRAVGQNEAWELARKLEKLDLGSLLEIFKECDCYKKIYNYTYQETAKKVAEWEKAKEEIYVGDVVRFKENNSVEFCVTDTLDDRFLYGINTEGGIYSDINIEFVEKTGRHIDIDSFLKQIRGKQE